MIPTTRANCLEASARIEQSPYNFVIRGKSSLAPAATVGDRTGPRQADLHFRSLPGGHWRRQVGRFSDLRLAKGALSAHGNSRTRGPLHSAGLVRRRRQRCDFCCESLRKTCPLSYTCIPTRQSSGLDFDMNRYYTNAYGRRESFAGLDIAICFPMSTTPWTPGTFVTLVDKYSYVGLTSPGGLGFAATVFGIPSCTRHGLRRPYCGRRRWPSAARNRPRS